MSSSRCYSQNFPIRIIQGRTRCAHDDVKILIYSNDTVYTGDCGLHSHLSCAQTFLCTFIGTATTRGYIDCVTLALRCAHVHRLSTRYSRDADSVSGSYSE